MRLLEYSHGVFSLTPNLLEEDIPEYAILSHTWGEDMDEVIFSDVIDGTGKEKAGYEKLRFCAKRASLDNLQYFWIDTCCINKRDYSELAEALNSMYKWYSKAAKCYVYLTDVRACTIKQDNKSSEVSWDSFMKSRWFTRGWTLQELIAPSSVEFFSVEGLLLGDKKSLKQQIHEITGISIKALEGEGLSHFSVEERISWTEHRNTTRKEDKAYCLMGIFGVRMSPIYGEGDHAFERLRNKILKYSSKPQPSSFRRRQLARKRLSVNVSADDFIAVNENGVENPGPDFPPMKYWYREEVGESGYPDSVVVPPKFQDPDVRPPGETILSLRAIPNIQLRGEVTNIPAGCYRVQWIVWLWAGKDYPVRGAEEGYTLNSACSTPIAHFTENSVVERIFPCKNPHDVLRRPDKPFWFPWGMRFSVGKAQHPGARFSYYNDNSDERPIAASELLQPGFEESVLSGGLWHTMKNCGWCEIGGGVVDVDEDGHLAFVVSLSEVVEENGRKLMKTFGGFSFAGVRLELVE